MAAAIATELEALLPGARVGDGATRSRSVLPIPATARSGKPTPAYGPMTHRVVELLERAANLSRDDIRQLAEMSARMRQGGQYAEALLAARSAAEDHGRGTAGSFAGNRAEWIVVQRADDMGELEFDCTRWTVLAEEAAWAAGDAARALAVSDLLSDAQLAILIAGWSAVCGTPRP